MMPVPQQGPPLPRRARLVSAWPLLVAKLGILAISALAVVVPDVPPASMTTWRLVLAVFTAILLADALHFGIGVSAVLLLTQAWPVYTLIVLGPSGEVMSAWNSSTHLIDKHFDALVTGSLYFYTALSVMLQVADARAAVVDVPLHADLRRLMGGPALSAAAATLAVVCTVAANPLQVPAALKGIDYGAAYAMGASPIAIGPATGALAVVACALAFFGQPGWLRSLALAFTPAWFLLNWDRVMVVGLLGVYLTDFVWRRVTAAPPGLSRALEPRRTGLPLSRVVLLVVLLAMSYLLLTYVGLIRGQGRVRVDEHIVAALAERMGKGALGGTIEGSIYAGAVAIEAANSEPHSQWSALAIGMLPDRLSPWGNPTYGARYLSNDLRATMGGLILPFEGYLSDGPVGLLLYPFFCVLASAMLVWLWRRLLGPLALGAAYVVVFCMCIRTNWYGIQSMLSMLLLAVPLIVLALRVVEGYARLLLPAPMLGRRRDQRT